MKSDREYRDMRPLEFDAQAETEQEERKVVRGYATTFNEPYTLINNDEFELREVVDPDAFSNTDMSDVIMQYDHEGRVFARIKNNTLTVTPDDHGLLIEADLGGTELGRQLYEEIRGGYTDKMSFGFTVSAEESTREVDERGRDIYLRRITGVGKLYDVSAVSIPANTATSISVRSLADGVIEQIRAERLEAERLEAERQALEKRRSEVIERALGGRTE